jgi:hypothetical protein
MKNINKLFSSLIYNEVGIIYTNTVPHRDKLYMTTDNVNYNFVLNLTGRKYVLEFKPHGINYNYKQIRQKKVDLTVIKTFGRQDKIKLNVDICNLLK